MGGGGGGVGVAGAGKPALPGFDRLHPSRFVVLSFPDPVHPSASLRVAVLDAPTPPPAPISPAVAAMLVPPGRESDWVFSTLAGHLQLLLSSSTSRLVLLGDPPRGDCPSPRYHRSDQHSTTLTQLERALLPFLLALSPKYAFGGGTLPEVPFLVYEDGVRSSAVLEVSKGREAGEFLVEDVELELEEGGGRREHRRRLRFKRMPNLIQTQMRLVPDTTDSSIYRVESGVLVQPYLAPMVAGMAISSSLIEKKAELGVRPRVLCLGVGGGALLTFLNSQLGLYVLGVEADEVVLGAARRHFGLVEDEFLRVIVGDGIRLFCSSREDCAGERCAGYACCELCRLRWWKKYFDGGVEMIMVDLDEQDAGTSVMAPPMEFVKKEVIIGARLVLHEQGILVINVVPLNGQPYDELVGYLHEVFEELYEIDVGNGENCVILATISPVGSLANLLESSFVKKISQTVGDEYLKAIRKI